MAEADGEDMDVAMAALAVGSVDPEGWKVVGARAAPPLGELEIAEDAAPGAKLTVGQIAEDGLGQGKRLTSSVSWARRGQR